MKIATKSIKSITDVPGVEVGQITLSDRDIQTGVTIINPGIENIFKNKLMAGATVFNGFGKSVGLIQINELGTLETPIVLTNTFSVGLASTTLIKYMVKDNPGLGKKSGTVNPVVLECNDGYLNDMQQFSIKEEHVFQVLNSTDKNFEQGAVGAGRGMSCYKLKGGIGSSSKKFKINNKEYIVGALVLTNMGKIDELRLPSDRNAGIKIAKIDPAEHHLNDNGSIIIILATNLPMLPYQLKRASKRAGNGIARTGSTMSNGSGEIALAFSTANQINHEKKDLLTTNFYDSSQLDPLFSSIVDVVEESILNSLKYAEDVKGFKGHKRYSINNYVDKIF